MNDHTDTAPDPDVERCSCGRVALARCWLGETFPARWLVSCPHARRRSDTPDAA